MRVILEIEIMVHRFDSRLLNHCREPGMVLMKQYSEYVVQVNDFRCSWSLAQSMRLCGPSIGDKRDGGG